MKRALPSVLLFLTLLCGAQSSDYTPLTCTGPIPEDFRILSMDKFRKDVKEEIKHSKNHYVNRTKEEFLLKSNYIIDELLQSGKVLFNDSVTEYVNRVADLVLAGEPELRAKLRFYCLKSSVTNAFSTNQGIIFVTLGLIAQLENEAQLAYVLAHEISHFEKKHTINSYLENERVFAGRENYRYNSYDSKIRMISKYSRELEYEADSLGILRYLQTDYKPSEVITAFDVLQFSYLPFGDIEFDPSFLNAGGSIKFPQSLILDTVAEINFDKEGDDDSKSTHPNVRKRRERAEGVMDQYKKKGSKTFIQSKELFFRIRTIARYESLMVDLADRQYVEVIYNCVFLLKDNPGSRFLNTVLCKALYGASKYKMAYKYGVVAEDYEEIEGNSQRCYYFFNKMESEELASVAFRFIYERYQLTGDPFLRDLSTDLLKDLIFREKYTMTFLQNNLETPVTDTSATGVKQEEKRMDEVPEDTTESDSKYSKLRKQKKEWQEKQVEEVRSSEPVERKYHLMAFDSIYRMPDFRTMHANATTLAEEKRKRENEKDENRRNYYRAGNSQQGQNLNLGLDTMVIVDPFYLATDERKGLKMVDSEQRLIGFTEDIRLCGQLAGLNLALIAPKSFSENDVDAYNDLSRINEWMGERLDHGEMDIIHLQSDLVSMLSRKYNTRYFCYTGVISTKEVREHRGYILLAGCVLYPALPIFAAIALSPINKTYYYTLVYDIETGKSVLAEKVRLNVKSNSGYVNSVMYDQMLQMKKEPGNQKTPLKSK